ncbi:MAG: ATP-dependent sacrificial sulfur transferase LarE [Candidatus Aureabacteria bacterium]|nr:ATP-dependent sacrificial sulfur transferase LarE [Candidatus Auribacterota bacterium]
MSALLRKYERLKKLVKSYGSLIVAYSGGVDSTLLLKVASDILGENVLAVTAMSAIYPHAELEIAKKTARQLRVRHRMIKSDALTDERFVQNSPERCYWCKLGLLKKLGALAQQGEIAHVAIASHMDDLNDYRPGERAVSEMGAVSPLRLAGFTKKDVRRLSRQLGLPGWRREAMACLASRFPYGERIRVEKLRRVENAEAFLRGKGFRNVRVRYAGRGARIEVDKAQLGRFHGKQLRCEIVRKLKGLGFISISLDIEGYRMGSLNYGLAETTQFMR